MKKSLFFISILGFAACSAFDDAEFTALHELATPESTIVVAQTGGSASFTIYSNGEVTLEEIGAEDAGASIDFQPFRGDGEVVVHFGPNEGMRRMVKLCLALDGGIKRDTLYAKQEGVQAFLTCAAPFKLVDGTKESMTKFDLSTNVPIDELAMTVSHSKGSQEWIKKIYPDQSSLIVETMPTGSEVNRASIDLTYMDGWGDGYRVSLFLTGSDKNGHFGRKQRFEDLKAFAGKGVVDEDIYVEGIVISDYRSANMELNPSISYDRIDVEENRRTAYVQTDDGIMGLRLKFMNVSDNVLAHGVALTFSLNGATVEKDAATDSYTVKELSNANIIKTSPPSSVHPKRRKIGELTDADLYTFVTVPDLEFACKHGSYTNVYENYTLKSSVNESNAKNNNRLDGWATLLVDGEGRAIYAPVNMLCLWRRSGNGVPQGRGPLTGIVVSNEIRRYGNVGRYQIRVLDEEGFGQDWIGDSAFIQLVEWDGAPYQYRFSQYSANPRFAYKKLESIVPSDDFSADNTIPRGELICENHEIGDDATYPLASYPSYTYVKADGLGAWPSSPVSDYRVSMRLSTEIKGWYDWTDGHVTGYKGICAEFSTQDISGSLLQVHFAFSVGRISAVTSQYFPAHWSTEYSTDGGGTWKAVPDAATGEAFVHLRALPWWDTTIGGIAYKTNGYCGLGCTEHVCYLPTDAFGVEKLKVRIRPYDTVMAIFPTDWDAEIETANIFSNTYVTSTTIQFDYLYFSYR